LIYVNTNTIGVAKRLPIVGRSSHRWKEFRSASIQQSRFVNLAISDDLGTVKYQLQTAVEINPQRGMSAFTRWVTRSASVLMCILLWFLFFRQQARCPIRTADCAHLFRIN